MLDSKSWAACVLNAARTKVVATAGDATPRRLATTAARRARKARDDFMFGRFAFGVRLIYEKLLRAIGRCDGMDARREPAFDIASPKSADRLFSIRKLEDLGSFFLDLPPVRF